jgi:hypothetical protein
VEGEFHEALKHCSNAQAAAIWQPLFYAVRLAFAALVCHKTNGSMPFAKLITFHAEKTLYLYCDIMPLCYGKPKQEKIPAPTQRPIWRALAMDYPCDSGSLGAAPCRFVPNPGDTKSRVLLRREGARRIHYFLSRQEAGESVNRAARVRSSLRVAATLTAMAPNPTPSPAVLQATRPAPDPAGNFHANATLTQYPDPRPFALQGHLTVSNIERQVFNNCRPDLQLAMLLSFWGWVGDQPLWKGVKALKEERNVMPYDMLDYVNAQTSLTGIVR